MKNVILKTQTAESIIHCGADTFRSYAPELKNRQLFIVTDRNVFSFYRELIWSTFGGSVPVVILPAGETAKTQRYLFEIISKMADAGMTRKCTVVAFGGGVVGDIAGLAACLYMRGVELVQIPTTLLSQVDSSVGGKTAIDFKKIKNLIGAFYQPKEVICDPVFLKTLPSREMRCGLGEIIKYGALDAAIFKKLLENKNNLYDGKFLDEITYDCINHKAQAVTMDERDLNGVRKTLNLGHTTGHAFELNYGRKSHGEFVLIGMYYEMFIAEKLGIGGGAYYENLRTLIASVIKKVPSYDGVREAAYSAKLDKKNESSSKISLIVPKIEGKSAEITLTVESYANYLQECCASLKDKNESN